MVKQGKRVTHLKLQSFKTIAGRDDREFVPEFADSCTLLPGSQWERRYKSEIRSWDPS